MKWLFYLFILQILLSCNQVTKESNELSMDKDVIVNLTYLTYFEPNNNIALAGFLIRYNNPYSYNIYIPYIQGIRSIIVEKENMEKYEYLDPLIYVSFEICNESPFFSPILYYTDTITLEAVNKCLINNYPNIDKTKLRAFTIDCCFIRASEKFDVFLPCSEFPIGKYRVYSVRNFSAIPFPDDAFERNPPKEFCNYRLFKGDFISDTIYFEVKAEYEFSKITPSM